MLVPSKLDLYKLINYNSTENAFWCNMSQTLSK